MLYDSLDTFKPHQASHSPTSHSSSSPTKSASYQRPLTKRQLAHLHREQLRYQSDRALAFLGVPNTATTTTQVQQDDYMVQEEESQLLMVSTANPSAEVDVANLHPIMLITSSEESSNSVHSQIE
ncbi:hypothetical protein FGO68_gene209 [Halteria grandinella]|uniref:Uncharacterized protein n=1 Tax=Halteria grandinella TaxID=5974 RepID=A0A8J8SY91_HALGN|nr:hypothetical protein FGO68_gene209 [Halteria grandinella]